MSAATPSPAYLTTYLRADELEAQLHAWATAHPSLVHLRELGRSREGRPIWLAIVGPDPDRVRPAVWVDANMHASELVGSNVALHIIHEVLQLHLGPPEAIPAPRAEVLRDLLFYVVPRISPDGAEAVLTTGRYVRSAPRDERIARATPRWLSEDLDGDGHIGVMRVIDPAGEMVESPNAPGLMVERTVDDPGPYYKLYPEGRIEHFDGHHVPSPDFLSDNPLDFNRNFPWSWVPAHEQRGAGAYPTSEPEVRAVVDFVVAHPNIFAWLNLHTFGGVVIRPLGHAPDAKMNQEDLAIFRQLEAWMTADTGYPTVSGYEEFLYAPDQPLHGDLTDFAYNQRGALAYVVELWDIFAELELPRPKKFVDYYERFSQADAVRLAAWDARANSSRLFRPWRPFQHPQLGQVELGGVDPRFGVWNPPVDRIAKTCADQARALLRVAAMAPRLDLEVTAHPLGQDYTRVDVVVRSLGYLGSYGLPSAKVLDFNEPVAVQATAIVATLEDAGSGHRVLGHLDGWGRGDHTGANLPHHPRTRGTTGVARTSYLVRGHGTVRIAVGCARTGWRESELSV